MSHSKQSQVRALKRAPVDLQDVLYIGEASFQADAEPTVVRLRTDLRPAAVVNALNLRDAAHRSNRQYAETVEAPTAFGALL